METNKIIEERGEIKFGGIVNEFLWTCAGVDKKYLRQCPTDYAKYAGIGGTIFFTALMATLSGGYAFSTIFESTTTFGKIAPVLFGVFWGLLIFNLDRFMVNTMYSDGKHTISTQEFLGGLPRIILAIFLGVVISTPIELRIFADKIESQLLIDQGNTETEMNAANQTLYDELNKLETERLELEERKKSFISGVSSSNNEIREKEKELSQAEEKLYNETNGTGITGIPGYGPAAKLVQDQVDRLKSELNQMRSEALADKENNKAYIDGEIKRIDMQIEDLDRKINEKKAGIDKVVEKRTAAKSALDGFTAQLNAMYEITDWSNSRTLFFARLMIMLLFISIEIIPTLFKMMLESGPYDDIVRAERHEIKVRSQKRISDVNDQINTSVMISTEQNKNRLEAEIKANKELLDKIALAQAEVLSKAIEKWREEELAKVEQNPGAYIKATTSTNISKKTNK